MRIFACSIKGGDELLDLLWTGESKIVSSESGTLPLLAVKAVRDRVGEWIGVESGEVAGEVSWEVVCEMLVIALLGGVAWSVLEDFWPSLPPE